MCRTELWTFSSGDFNDKTALCDIAGDGRPGGAGRGEGRLILYYPMEKGSPFASAVNQNGDRQKLTKEIRLFPLETQS
ncbi:MAG: hypothetical protein ACLR23_22645 [Clostridia bacterium]